MKDFFISYNQADRQWAEWIAWLLEEAGYSTIIQAWDFRPGSNFVLDMHRATTEANRTIAVLSEDYLKSLFANSEWAAAFARDPTSVLPVRVRICELKGLLTSIIYIDLVELEEERAREVLLAGVNKGRAKPVFPPNFPGLRQAEQSVLVKPQFPGRQTDLKTLTGEWLSALYRLRDAKQISPEDHISVLKHLLPGEIDFAADRQCVEALLAQCHDFAKKAYQELSDVKQISKRVVTPDVARVHQILTAIQLKLDVVLLDQGVRFVLIPPGISRNGVINRSCFYLAETVLSESDWARIRNLPSKDSSQPKLNLSLNDVRALLESVNQGSHKWMIPSSDQWLFAVDATESVMPGQRSMILKAAPPSSFGVYDLLGVIWQFTKCHRGVEVQGGSYLTTISSTHKTPAPEPVCMDDLEGDDWGFRPALLL